VWAPRTAAPFMQNTGSYVLKVHGMTYKAGRRIRNEQLNFFFFAMMDVRHLLRALMIRNISYLLFS
jgi:hypothetical protein